MNEPPPTPIRKAVIPAAGFGTRLFPATKVIKKEFFPIIDQQGRVKPVIQLIVEEAINAGIEEIGIVVQSRDRSIFEDYFQHLPSQQLLNKLSSENQAYSLYLQDLGERITLINQEVPEGYGHAVFCAKKWVNNEPFLLMLGDHVYQSKHESSCAAQLLEIYQQTRQNVIGLTSLSGVTIQKAGCVTGVWQKPNSMLTLTQIYEKPTLEYARQHLHIPGMPEDEFLCIFGLYALSAKIFDYLAENITNNHREKGEFQLTSCLEKLRQAESMIGYVVAGKSFDIGLPDAYRQTLIDFR